MNGKEQKRLMEEAARQMVALKTIAMWKYMAIGLSAIGAAGTYVGFWGNRSIPVLGGTGIALALTGLAGAMILNLGLKNGRRNVNKILAALDKRNGMTP